MTQTPHGAPVQASAPVELLATVVNPGGQGMHPSEGPPGEKVPAQQTEQLGPAEPGLQVGVPVHVCKEDIDDGFEFIPTRCAHI